MTRQFSKIAVLIAGATASGKSARALAMARERGGVIINADAVQVYRELRILSARPTPDEERAVPHRLYGHVSGSEAYSVGHWLSDVETALREAWAAGQLPIVVGGTGLYFRALEQGLADVPPIAPEIRQRWRNFTGDLHAELAKRHSASAERLQALDRQRLIRALEVIEATGRPLSHWQEQARGRAPLAGAAVEHHFIDIPRPELNARAEARFHAMVRDGAVEEVRALSPLDPQLPVMKAIGVRELGAHLNGETTLEQAIAAATLATRHYIKRQLTWWRGQGRHFRDSANSPKPL